MFTEKHADDLLRCEWLPKLHDGVAYLGKFLVYPDDRSAVFLITDTKNVWSEVVKYQRLIERYSSLNQGNSRGNGTQKSGNGSLSLELAEIGEIHQLRHFVDAEIAISPGSQTDLSVSIEYQNKRWNWQLDSVGHRFSSSILSKHLIIPLIVTNGFAFTTSSETPLADQKAVDLQKELDHVSKIAKRNPLLNAVQALKRPKLATSLSRVTAMINGVDANYLPSVVTEYDEIDETPVSTGISDRLVETLLKERPNSTLEASLPGFSYDAHQSTLNTRVPPLPELANEPGKVAEDETMHTGPDRLGLEQTKDDDDATESSDHSEPPPSKKRKVIGEELQSSSQKSKVQQWQKESSPSSRQARPKDKKGDTDSDSSSSATGFRKRAGGSKIQSASERRNATGVRQPLKRGGRRL
ncbi:hypothetical protein M408DRAFT_327283 [Serendipita vermifera MAFF 305830]|uniref:XLF-like N-terminal domain-containing protein n=1 Tax=Serendipita vermifera MAFF 305830 TaxID=933852 RepID=A0A0C3BK64_SERVB|nr:hypothetical protein M408DRAFT_327283 [Serendipita vermifera MAFF 305830]